VRLRPQDASPIAAPEAAALFAGLPRGALLVAVSGGPDSVALLGLLAEADAAGAPARPLFAATIDHGLRAEARAEAEMVARMAAGLGVAHAILPWTGPKPTTGLQEAARAARRRLLVGEARRTGCVAILTAHTLDDQAETVLMRAAAGSGLQGLRGMRAHTRIDGLALIRPLLGVAKTRLVATCRTRGWRFADDPTNADPRFARARWRTIAPLLAAEGLDAARIAALAARLALADDALEAKAAQALAAARSDDGIDARRLFEEPIEIARRAVGRLVAAGGGGAAPRLARLEALVDALAAAVASASPLRRTLGGVAVRLDARGRLTIAPEPLRRRGLRQGASTNASLDPWQIGSRGLCS
jgi:tRNA(Ile)-lysidine synthase